MDRLPLSPILLALVMSSTPVPAESDPESITDGVFRRQQEMADGIDDAQFRADYVYVEADPSGGREKTVEAARRVFMKGYNRQKHVFQSMRLNGRELTGIEMQRELIPWRVQEAMIARTRMPFALNEREHYRFELAGEETLDGSPVWRLRFEPLRRTLGCLEGSALVSCSDSNVLQLRFAPVVRPAVVEQMSIVLDYDEVGDYLMPARFEMDLDIRVTLIATLFRRRVRVQERYSDYRFNSGLDDDFFR